MAAPGEAQTHSDPWARRHAGTATAMHKGMYTPPPPVTGTHVDPASTKTCPQTLHAQ